MVRSTLFAPTCSTCILAEPNCAPIEVFIGVLGTNGRMLYQTKVLKPLSQVKMEDVAQVFPSSIEDWQLRTGNERFRDVIQAREQEFDKVT